MEHCSVIEKKLCMAELHAEHSYYEHTHYFDIRESGANTSFVYITKGRVVFSAVGMRLEAGEGELVFFPEGLHYHAVWQGNPEIEYYALHIISNKYDVSNNDRYPPQKLEVLSRAETGALFAQIYHLFETGERVSKVRAIGLYYGFYAEALPYLDREAPVRFSETLLKALDYIRCHADTDFPMSLLSAELCISETKLYQLFRVELHTTPIHYRNEIRVENGTTLLRTTDLSVDAVSDACGFHSAIYFRETFKDYTGMTPREYRNLVKNRQ
ncbi:MAG: AraC family transcriptional regulator [Clostridia bacterium]|nr:AraC family transcriptional regulator [Clostridia bacterium]